MIYEEKNWKPFPAYTVFVILTLIALSPWLMNFYELHLGEGFYAALVHGITGFPPMALLFGKLSGESFPLFPLLAKGFADMGFSMETSLRLVSFCSLVGLTGIVMVICRLAMGHQAAWAGGAVLLTNILMCDKFSEGTPSLLCALGIFSAWMVWFEMGIWRASWKSAWLLTGWIAGLTFYAGGWNGLALLVIPLFFLRRPLNIWGKPRGPAFVLGILLIVFFIVLWGLPRWNNGAALGWYQAQLHFPTIKKYLIHLLVFPFDMALRFMPWTLFAWAPFCPALQTLDENPILSKFLRTLFLVVFVLLWFSPFTDSRDMLIALPPLAALIGLNYWIVVRRYGWRLLKVCEIASVFAVCAGLLILAFLLVPERLILNLMPWLSRSISIRSGMENIHVLAVIYSTAGCLAAVTVWIAARRGTAVWAVMILTVLSFMFPYYGITISFKAADRSHRTVGEQIRSALGKTDPSQITVYKFDSLPRLYAEMHYAGTRVQSVQSESELPKKMQTIYVLSPVVPSEPRRSWTQLCLLQYKSKRLELWKGEKRKNDYDE